MAWRQETLLCIVDSQSNLNICKIILEDFGQQILNCQRRPRRAGSFASNAIDAVILDYQMPEMNAELVAAATRGTKPHVPILMLSDWVSLRESVLQLVDGFVIKGDPVEFLLLAIHQRLSRHKKRKPIRAVTQPREASFHSGARSLDRKLSLLRSP